jgi:hypothetical protein
MVAHRANLAVAVTSPDFYAGCYGQAVLFDAISRECSQLRFGLSAGHVSSDRAIAFIRGRRQHPLLHVQPERLTMTDIVRHGITRAQ